MSFELNGRTGNWLNQLNGRRIKKIYQVDFNNDRHHDIYLPWIFFIIFSDFDFFLEIEGDFDGNHIKINLIDNEKLNKKLTENNLPDEPYLWHVYDTEPNEILGKLLGQEIDFIEFGIDKDEYEINGTKIKGQKEYFNFIRFILGNLKLTIFEGSATGLGVSDNDEIKLGFEDTFDVFNTK